MSVVGILRLPTYVESVISSLQVPWGKHYPASFRGQHGTRTDKDVPYQNSLPLVAVREPYMWLQVRTIL